MSTNKTLIQINMKKILLVWLGLFMAVCANTSTSIDRYMLVAGANDGGGERVKLRYANQDAQSIAKVFIEMGGVRKDRVIYLKNPSQEELQKSMVELTSLLNKAPATSRKEVIVYYSGHANESGLLLGTESFGWKDLRLAVDGLPAQVKIAVLDACGSGAITRLKGGERQPAFLFDVSSDMKGYAFLTSSSDNEVAQESDRIGGSYFTQSLVTGLRGAADLNSDQKVTLSEAYQYAFKETMHRTQSTSGGTQHPSHDMKLSGTGDVVMTDLREVSAGLVFAKQLEGRIYIRDQKGTLIAELNKGVGSQLELGLAPSTYTIYIDKNGKKYKSDEIILKESARQTVDHANFKQVNSEKTITRGDQKEDSVMDSLRNAYIHDGPNWKFGFFHTKLSTPWNGHQASLLFNLESEQMLGHQFSFVANISTMYTEGWQVGALINYAENINGWQASAGINAAKQVKGIQLAAGLNLANDIDGFQIAPMNIAKEVKGHQFGHWNLGKDVHGYQVSAWNIVQEVDKSQIGAWNIAQKVGQLQVGAWNISGSTGKLQAGVWNIAGHVNGPQIGVWNIGGVIDGPQIGVWNIGGKIQGPSAGIWNIHGKTEGATFGIVNMIGYTNKPVYGILNFVGNGYLNLGFSASELGLANTLQIGTAYMHTNFHFSKNKDDVMGVGYGVGSQFGMKGPNWIGLNADLYNLAMDHEDLWKDDWSSRSKVNHLAQIRVEYGRRFAKYIGAYVGISNNILMSSSLENVLLLPPGDYQFDLYDDELFVWPGLYAGIKLGRL